MALCTLHFAHKQVAGSFNVPSWQARPLLPSRSSFHTTLHSRQHSRLPRMRRAWTSYQNKRRQAPHHIALLHVACRGYSRCPPKLKQHCLANFASTHRSNYMMIWQSLHLENRSHRLAEAEEAYLHLLDVSPVSLSKQNASLPALSLQRLDDLA